MKLVMCAVRDAATEMFGRPFFVQSRAVAVRSFRDEVRRGDAQNDLHNHPEDFTLFELGSFDDSTGVFEPNLGSILRATDVDLT